MNDKGVAGHMVERKHTGSDAAAASDEGDDGGFTLIELMVVVLVIAILLTIAIPTFLGARQRGQDRAAQSNLRNVLTAAKVLFVDTGDYSTATVGNLEDIEPGLGYVDSTVVSASETSISVESSGTSTARPVFSAAILSDSGTCWLIRDDSDAGGTFYGINTSPGTGDCDANAAKAPAATATRSFPTG